MPEALNQAAPAPEPQPGSPVPAPPATTPGEGTVPGMTPADRPSPRGEAAPAPAEAESAPGSRPAPARRGKTRREKTAGEKPGGEDPGREKPNGKIPEGEGSVPAGQGGTDEAPSAGWSGKDRESSARRSGEVGEKTARQDNTGEAPSARRSGKDRESSTGRSGNGGEKPARRAPGNRPGQSPAKTRRRRRPSPVPVSMWLLPRFRLPFATPLEFARWFFTGINLWAVAAVVLCVFGGCRLVEALNQPRLPGAEQALAGGEATAGLSYRVERTGEGEVTVTGQWDPEAGEEPPGPELAAALCAALSPEEIYGHSDHLYRSIASRFFDGEDFDLAVVLREKEPDKPEEGWEPPEPVFSITRGAGEADWPQPDCDPAFARAWRDCYDGYWLFGQGRKEDLGPPQSDPIIEEGDLPSEPPPDSSEEEAPPLPDLDGEGEEPQEPGEDPPPDPDGTDQPEDPDEPEESDASSDGGSSSSREEPQEETEPPEGLERFFQWVLDKAKEYRRRSF